MKKFLMIICMMFAFLMGIGERSNEKKSSTENSIVEFRGYNAMRFIDEDKENYLYVRKNGKINIVKINKSSSFMKLKHLSPQDFLIRLNGKSNGKVSFNADAASTKQKETEESFNARYRKADIWAQREYYLTGRKPGGLLKAEYASQFKKDVWFYPVEFFSMGTMSDDRIEEILSAEKVTFVYSDFIKMNFMIDEGSMEKYRSMEL